LNYIEVLPINREDFFMKKFLYLRVNAIVSILACVVFYLYTMSGDLRSLQTSVMYFAIFSLLLFAVPTIHNLLLLHIYRKYYPETTIPKSLGIWNIVLSIVCSFYFLVFVVTIASYPIRRFREEQKPEVLMTFILTAVLCITTLTQIIGSFRLIKIVKENARLQLEDSFA
jgi:uncharacterized membrane protein YhaH (DUF805 family)